MSTLAQSFHHLPRNNNNRCVKGYVGTYCVGDTPITNSGVADVIGGLADEEDLANLKMYLDEMSAPWISLQCKTNQCDG